MPKYRINGVVYEAASPDEAYAQAASGSTGGDPERAKRMAAFERQKAAGEFDTKYSAASDSGLENFLAGAGSGLVGVGRRAANLALPRALEPEWATEEAIKGQKATDQDLMGTGAGMAGKMVGEIAATLPVGGALGAGGKVLAASRSVPLARAGVALSRPTGYGARAAVAGLEGAGQAALTSEPGSGVKETLTGGGLGAGMGVLGKAVGAAGRALRPSITDEARTVMKEADTFIPASQALPEGSIGKQAYEGLLANLPGSGGKIRAQRTAAVDDVRRTLTEEAMPRGANPVGAFQSGDRMKDVVSELKGYWDEAYDDIYKQTIPGVSIPQELADVIQSRAGTSIKVGGNLTGREALDLQQAIQQVINETPRGPLEKAARGRLIQAKNQLDSHIKSSLPSPLRRKLVSNAERYKTYLGIKNAANKSIGGEFTLKQAARELGRKGSREENFALDAATALKDFPSRQGIFQTLAATGALGGAGVLGASTAGEDATAADRLQRAAMFMGGAYYGPRALASERAQKMLFQYGDQGVLDKYAKGLRRFGQAGRMGAVNAASQMQEE